VKRVPLLVEQDFGFYEGKKFFERPREGSKSGKEAHHARHKDDPGFVDVESKESMAQRADAFLDEHLTPLLRSDIGETQVVAIVSHGIFLTVLWRRLLLRLPSRSVSFAPAISWATDAVSLEHLGGWSNTGYLELELAKSAVSFQSTQTVSEFPAVDSTTPTIDCSSSQSITGDKRPPTHPDPEVPEVISRVADDASAVLPITSRKLEGWTLIIYKINSQDHIQGLKRTGGGVGSAKYDESQKTIETFFKRKKVG